MTFAAHAELALRAMGLIRDTLHNHHMNDPVRGTALVVDVNDWLLETHTPYTLRATLVVGAEGVPKTTVEHSELVNASTGDHLLKWPEQGATIPVTIDRADPTRVVIEWDDMQSKTDMLREADRAAAEVQKQQLLAQAYGTNDGPAGGSTSTPSDSALVCASCHGGNPEGTTFCRHCGAMLTRS
jgi:hypothetical protein